MFAMLLRHQPSSRTSALLRIAAYLLLATSTATAQAPSSTPSNKTSGQPAVTAVHVSLQSLWQAPRTQDFTALQLRRFYAPAAPGSASQPLVTTVRELLVSDANGQSAPAFRLQFQGVEGELPGSVVNTQWANTYLKHSRRFHESGSFQVRDLAQAQANYAMHSFSNVVRAGRTATRVVVYPSQLDKSIWVVDVDQTTSLPLYCAEFDRQLRVLSEVEVLSLTLTAQVPSQANGNMREFATFAEAVAEIEGGEALIEPDAQVVGEYRLSKAVVRDDPLHGRSALLMTYTDGVDEFQVTQEATLTDPFAQLPAQLPASGRTAHTIARYSDHSMRVLMFWADGVSFQVAGKGSLTRLDELSRTVYARALTN